MNASLTCAHLLTAATGAAPVLTGWALHALSLRRRIALARRDPLTGLSTRALWQEHAARLIRDPRAVVLLVDLDDFKAINDNLGHHAGDLVLTEAAARLSLWCGPRGSVGRIGGDEFTAVRLLPHDESVTDRIASLEAAFDLPVDGLSGRLPFGIGASIGYVRAIDHPDSDLSGLLRLADAAMYRAKAGRKGARQARAGQDPVSNGRRLGRDGTNAGGPVETAA